MPDIHRVTVIGSFAREITSHVGRAVSQIKSQAPAARMIGEFAVKLGIGELRKRVSGPASARPTSSSSHTAEADDEADVHRSGE